MVRNEKTFKVQLGKLRIEAITNAKAQNREMQEQYNTTIRRAETFLENLEKLNSFYNNDESIEAVFAAAVFHLTAHDNLRLAKKTNEELSKDEVEGYKQAIFEAHRTLVTTNQLLVNKIESPDENMYAIHGESKIRGNAFAVGIGVGAAISGFALILATAIVSAPVIAPILAFGIVALLLGSLLTLYSAQNLNEFENIAAGAPLEEITLFINYLDGDVSPIGTKELSLNTGLLMIMKD